MSGTVEFCMQLINIPVDSVLSAVLYQVKFTVPRMKYPWAVCLNPN